MLKQKGKEEQSEQVDISKKFCPLMTAGMLVGCTPKNDPFSSGKEVKYIACSDRCQLWDGEKCGLIR